MLGAVNFTGKEVTSPFFKNVRQGCQFSWRKSACKASIRKSLGKASMYLAGLMHLCKQCYHALNGYRIRDYLKKSAVIEKNGHGFSNKAVLREIKARH